MQFPRTKVQIRNFHLLLPHTKRVKFQVEIKVVRCHKIECCQMNAHYPYKMCHDLFQNENGIKKIFFLLNFIYLSKQILTFRDITIEFKVKNIFQNGFLLNNIVQIL